MTAVESQRTNNRKSDMQLVAQLQERGSQSKNVDLQWGGRTSGGLRCEAQ